MKQTAVEWLVNELNNKIDYIPIKKWDMIRDIIMQAKEMEKEQIIKSAQDNFYAGQDLANGYKTDWKSAEDYYNKTFKSE